MIVKNCSISKWTDLSALTNLYFEHRTLDLIFFFLIVWYYCTLTIRESILKVNGSKIKVRFLNNLSIFFRTGCLIMKRFKVNGSELCPFFWNGSSKIQFFTNIWYSFCQRLLRPSDVIFLITGWWNTNIRTSWSH